MVTTIGMCQTDKYSYESVRYFSDREIANLLPSIKKVNPHIKNLNRVYPGWVVNVPIDGALVSLFVNPGDMVISLLERGIPEIRIADAKFIYASTKKYNGDQKEEKIIPPEENQFPYTLVYILSGLVVLRCLILVYRLYNKKEYPEKRKEFF